MYYQLKFLRVYVLNFITGDDDSKYICLTPLFSDVDHYNSPTTSKHLGASGSGANSALVDNKRPSACENASILPSTLEIGQKRKKTSNVVLSSDSETEAEPPKKKTLKQAAAGKTTSGDSSFKSPAVKRSRTGRLSKTGADDAAHPTVNSNENEHSKRDGEVKKGNKATPQNASKQTEVKNVGKKGDTEVENLNPTTNKPKYFSSLYLTKYLYNNSFLVTWLLLLVGLQVPRSLARRQFLMENLIV